jgi:hypothetical protein
VPAAGEHAPGNEQAEQLVPFGLPGGTTMISIGISNNCAVCSVARHLHSKYSSRRMAYKYDKGEQP